MNDVRVGKLIHITGVGTIDEVSRTITNVMALTYTLLGIPVADTCYAGHRPFFT